LFHFVTLLPLSTTTYACYRSLSLAALAEGDTVKLLRFQPVMLDRDSHFVEENLSRR
jgi:hypothetical protein